MKLDTEVRRNPRIVSQELGEGDGAVLLHMDTSAYHSLNPTGAWIWKHLEQPAMVGELLARFRDEVEDAPPTLSKDLLLFLQHLAHRELILTGAPGAGSGTKEGNASGGVRSPER